MIPLDVLIVEASPELGALWARHLERAGANVRLACDDRAAIAALETSPVDMIVADLDLPGTGAMAVADYAAYRHPDALVVFVTASSFFSDGSVFADSANACAVLPKRTAPEDIAAIVTYHGARTAKS
ncbi:response regulator [Maritimibacter dapengensis]|uniref:response regulator n=1 Tax=Maritimibacter dapengensis TaxID=2836868 RepID=UPI003AB940FB